MRKLRVLFIFLSISLFVFWLAFGTIGHTLSDLWTNCLNAFFNVITGAFGIRSATMGISGLFVSGVIPAFETLLGLLPQLFILFSFFYLLENTNLINQISGEFARFFARAGLDSRTIINIVMGFGCGTVAVSTLSTIKDDRTRARAAILLSFIPCSAQAPIVLMLLSGILKLNFFLIFLLYIATIFIGLFISIIAIPKQKQPLKFELSKSQPNSKLIKQQSRSSRLSSQALQSQHISSERSVQYNAKNSTFALSGSAADGAGKTTFSIKQMLISVLIKTGDFFKRISGAVLISAAVLWLLTTYKFNFQPAADIADSALFQICGFMAPLFAPLGLNSAAVIAALVFGIIGKEMTAVAIAIFAPSGAIMSTAMPFGFTSASLLAFVVFFLLYPPCIPCIKAISVQTNRRTASIAVILNIAVAYAAAFLVYIICIIL